MDELSVSLHIILVLKISLHTMLSKIPNLRYFEIVDWRGLNRPAFIAIFHYIDNFGFFRGDSVKFQEGNFLINWTDFVDNIRALRCKVHEQNLYHGSPNLFRILTELRDLETDVSLVGSHLLSLHDFWRKWNHYQFRI